MAGRLEGRDQPARARDQGGRRRFLSVLRRRNTVARDAPRARRAAGAREERLSRRVRIDARSDGRATAAMISPIARSLLPGFSCRAFVRRARMRERLVSSLRLRRGEQPKIHRAVRALAARRKVRLPPLSLRLARQGWRRDGRSSSSTPPRARARSSGSTPRRTRTAACTRNRCVSFPAISATRSSRVRTAWQTVAAGVDVRDRKSGKTTTISCSERPRFYIFELKGLVPCDPETPVGTACVK